MIKATVRDVNPGIKTELRKAIEKALPEPPLLKTLYEEAGFEVKYERPRD